MDDCVVWPGPYAGAGYGVTKRPDGSRVYAHRLAYESAYGPIPPGMYICHHCDNPPCVNPEHLFLGSPKDNQQDARRKGRSRDAPLPGELNGMAKLSLEDVEEIRSIATSAKRPGFQRFRRGSGLVRSLSERFGVTPEEVHNIIRGANWKGIDVREVRA